MGTRLCKEWENNFPTQLQFSVPPPKQYPHSQTGKMAHVIDQDSFLWTLSRDSSQTCLQPYLECKNLAVMAISLPCSH